MHVPINFSTEQSLCWASVNSLLNKNNAYTKEHIFVIEVGMYAVAGAIEEGNPQSSTYSAEEQ